MNYVFMVFGEDGCTYRAYGTDFLSDEHFFPSFDEDDDDMVYAFEAWADHLTERANKEHREIFGDEGYVILELLYSDMFKRMGYHELMEYAESDF